MSDNIEFKKSIKKTEERYKEIDKYSPMMQHYIETKYNHKDGILFYRLGDFFELFFEDAKIVSKELELTLTGKECGVEERAPMCGIPHKAVDQYILKLVDKGYKICICDQVEDPKKSKGMVKREVTKIVTPGTVTDVMLLEEKKNNYIMSIYKDINKFGISICDISTGELYTTVINEENNFESLLDEISRYNPTELIINEALEITKSEMEEINKRFNIYVSTYQGELDRNQEKIMCLQKDYQERFYLVNNKEEQIKYNDIKDSYLMVFSNKMLMDYIVETQKQLPGNIDNIVYYKKTKYMSLGMIARKNLELTERIRESGKKGTLLWVLDKTSTSMGGRMMRRWISDPLIEVKEINERLDAVEELKDNIILLDEVQEALKTVYDIERLSGKLIYGSANARDMISLKNSVSNMPYLKKCLKDTKSKMLQDIYKDIDELEDVYKLIEIAIVDDPPITVTEGGLFKKGYNDVLDKLILIQTNAKQYLANMELEEKEKTKIKSLKIGYNKVFGYYIEVTNSYLDLVPEDRYIRKQTLTGGERFITEELKNLENEIIGAKDKISTLEYQEFCDLRDKIKEEKDRLKRTSIACAKLDCLLSFAKVAIDMNYVKPEVNDGDEIDIKAGRHPVVEKILHSGDFVVNDVYMNTRDSRLNIITGPNMAGKSTYMRQVALITLMAQIGSFVPADEAKIGVVDQIFTRVGASDDLSMGESTFMVEMMEVAQILKNATSKSLVILDEIGRGTSTYDGLAIAWAVAEYILKIKAKTLFATHYHELITLENKLEGAKNYHVQVKERGEDIIFLRTIKSGGTDESYGVHVAKLAGIPKDALKRANEMLRLMERRSVFRDENNNANKTNKAKKEDDNQISLYNYKFMELAHELDKIDINNITAIEALTSLAKLKDMLK